MRNNWYQRPKMNQKEKKNHQWGDFWTQTKDIKWNLWGSFFGWKYTQTLWDSLFSCHRSVWQHELRWSKWPWGRHGGGADTISVAQHRPQTPLCCQWQRHSCEQTSDVDCKNPSGLNVTTALIMYLLYSGGGNPRVTHSRQHSDRCGQPGGVCVSSGSTRRHCEMSNQSG